MSENEAKIKEPINKTDKKLLWRMFLRSFTVFAAFNYGKQGGDGFEYSIRPFINEYYKDPEKKKAALKRNVVFYNCTQYIGTFIMGLVASMEKQAAQHDDYNTSSINAMKASLMGPMSGIGDTLFWGILRVIAAGVSMSLAAQGNFLAPWIFLLIFNIPAIWIRWEMAKLGYSVGSQYIEDLYTSGMLNIFTKGAKTLGLIMLGGMTSSLVSFKTKVNIQLGHGQSINFQNIFDQILKGLLPLSITLLCFWLLTKKKMNFTILVICTIFACIVLSGLGIA